MEKLKTIGAQVNSAQPSSQNSSQQQGWQGHQAVWNGITLKKLAGGFLLAIGYLLSPLCWWNDLIFNLPVAYGFGYVCSLFSSNFLLPGSIAG
jgi:hypothetical protein